MFINIPIKALFDIILSKNNKSKSKFLKQAFKKSQLSCKFNFGI
jgi:hypothetical protein